MSFRKKKESILRISMLQIPPLVFSKQSRTGFEEVRIIHQDKSHYRKQRKLISRGTSKFTLKPTSMHMSSRHSADYLKQRRACSPMVLKLALQEYSHQRYLPNYKQRLTQSFSSAATTIFVMAKHLAMLLKQHHCQDRGQQVIDHCREIVPDAIYY